MPVSCSPESFLCLSGEVGHKKKSLTAVNAGVGAGCAVNWHNRRLLLACLQSWNITWNITILDHNVGSRWTNANNN